jgi:hypothetical protein
MLDAPSGLTSISAKMGSSDRKSTTYDVWSLGDDSQNSIGAEEMKSFALLAPSSTKAGKLFVGVYFFSLSYVIPSTMMWLVAPQIPTRHIVFSALPPSSSLDTQPTQNGDLSWAKQKNPPRPSYPTYMLKHRFVPFGSVAKSAMPTTEDNMDVDLPSPRTRRIKAENGDDDKVKKRKIEGRNSPKKKSRGMTA